ncbi:Endonuclease III [Candidatus Magnetomoraceae bacterium gMMP-15]
MSLNISRINKILEKLKKIYPDVKTQLSHQNPFQLLVATILSAQCTDKQVNAVTSKLFVKLKTPHDFAEVPIERLEKLIHSTGFFRNKSKNIKKCSQILLENYNGKVPDSLEELIKLPGVGRKTANVVLGAAYGISGIVVDTHVKRISQRLGMTKKKDPVKIEFDLMKIVPEKSWNDFSLQLIYLGRQYCKARNPACTKCPILTLCYYNNQE